MNILIAGASGFIGTELANHLSKNRKSTVLGRKLEKLKRPLFLKKPGFAVKILLVRWVTICYLKDRECFQSA